MTVVGIPGLVDLDSRTMFKASVTNKKHLQKNGEIK